jgi:hypothetical protein
MYGEGVVSRPVLISKLDGVSCNPNSCGDLAFKREVAI